MVQPQGKREQRNSPTVAIRIRQRTPPTIGITPDLGPLDEEGPSRYEVKKAYADAVLAAGGLPLVLPYARDAKVIGAYVDCLDGLVVTGGAFDVPPAEYGQTPRPGCGPLKPERTSFERALIDAALDRNLAVLGVCGGMQLLNVILGGTLYQDLATELPTAGVHEQQSDRRRPSHEVVVTKGSKLAKAVGEGPLMVNSSHHQAVHFLGQGVAPTAVAVDGVVEAIEAERHRYAVGVQWHPETLLTSVPANLGLFRAFVKAARARP